MAHRVVMIVGLLLAGYVLPAIPRASGVQESTLHILTVAAPLAAADDHNGNCPDPNDHSHRGRCATVTCGATHVGLLDDGMTVPGTSGQARLAPAAMVGCVGINAVPAIPPPRFRA